MILDIRLIRDRDGIVRASIDGIRVDIPETESASQALRMLAGRIDAVAWWKQCDEFSAARSAGGTHGADS